MTTTTQNSVSISSKALSSVLVSAKSENSNLKGGVFTLQSIATSKDYTFRINTKPYRGKVYTHVYVEVEYLKFKHIGTYFKGAIYKKGQRVDSPSAKAIAFVLSNVEAKNFDKLDNQMRTYHTGKCIKCNRTLTDALSIEIGLGPICRGY